MIALKIVVPAELLAKAVIKHLLPAARRRAMRLQKERENKKDE